MRMHSRASTVLFVLISAALAAGCSDDEGVSSDEEARRAYLGLDPSIPKSIDLGFAGYNAADSANIDDQVVDGDETGTLTVGGQVSQSNSDNLEMRLYTGFVDYSDGLLVVVYEDEEIEVDLTYDTSEVQTEQPFFDLSLRNIPDGTYDGTLTGTYQLTGDIDGEVTLNLSISGEIQDAGGGAVERVPGSTTVTGTATSGDGSYDVDLTL